MVVARWLLAPVRLDEALVGDLEEQVARGKSTMWLLRQLLLALFVRVGRLFRERPLALVRCMIIGWGTALALQFLAIVVAGSAEPVLVRWAVIPGSLTVRMWWFAYHTHFVVSGSIGLAFAGWLVARTSSSEDRAVLVLVLFASVVAWQLTGNFYWTALPDAQRAWVALDGWTTVAVLLLMPLSVLLGGLLRVVSD
jgi:hypothetical protein